MRMVSALFIALLLLTNTACSKIASSPNTNASPDLKISALDGTCLNLEAIAAQMNSGSFNFKGSVYTRDFEVMGSIFNSAFADSLYANSWRHEMKSIDGLPDLKGLKQEQCERVTLPGLEGLRLPYRISGSSLTQLEMQFDRTAFAELLKDLPEGQRQSMLDFPAVHRLLVYVPHSNQVEVTTFYTTVPMICLADRSYEVREQMVYRWRGNTLKANASDDALVEPVYWQRLISLIQPAQLPENPGELVTVSHARSEDLNKALKARTYEICN